MRQMLKNKLKDQKGFTLIELLAVIVILGIIAAIAVPSILGIIDNTKKDAHVANAQQMISAAKMLVASESTYQAAGPFYVTLSDLETKKYLDPVSNPDSGDYTKVASAAITADADDASFVKLANGKVIGVKIVNGTRGLKKFGASGAEISTKDITRDLVDTLANVNK